jgi:hypothetical protein
VIHTKDKRDDEGIDGVKAGDQEDGEGDEQGHVDTYEIDLARVRGAGGTGEEGGG